MIARPVLKENVSQLWSLVEPHLKRAFDLDSSDYCLEHAKVYLVSGEWQLVVLVDESDSICGACTVQFINRPNDRVAFVTAMSGKFITDTQPFESFKTLMRSYGATKMQGAASTESRLKLYQNKFGMSSKYTIVEGSL